MSFKVSFVCTGNTCRSYLAEAIAKHLLREKHLPYEGFVEVSSAGTMASSGSRISKMAERALEEIRVSKVESSPMQVSVRFVEESDLILAMTRSHHELLLQRFEGAAEKTFVLKFFAKAVAELGREFQRKRVYAGSRGAAAGRRPSEELTAEEVGAGTRPGESGEVKPEIEALTRLYLLINDARFLKMHQEYLKSPDEKLDIKDPVGLGLEHYIGVAREIWYNINLIFDYLFPV